MAFAIHLALCNAPGARNLGWPSNEPLRKKIAQFNQLTVVFSWCFTFQCFSVEWQNFSSLSVYVIPLNMLLSGLGIWKSGWLRVIRYNWPHLAKPLEEFDLRSTGWSKNCRKHGCQHHLERLMTACYPRQFSTDCFFNEGAGTQTQTRVGCCCIKHESLHQFFQFPVIQGMNTSLWLFFASSSANFRHSK